MVPVIRYCRGIETPASRALCVYHACTPTVGCGRLPALLRGTPPAARSVVMKSRPTAALARVSARHPWRIIAAWVAALVLAIAAVGLIGMRITTEFEFATQPESLAGFDVLTDAGLVNAEDTGETVIIRSDGLTVSDPAFRERADEVAAPLRGMDGVVLPGSVINYYELVSEPAMEGFVNGLVSADRSTLLIPLTLAGTQDEAAENAPAYRDRVGSFSDGDFEVLSIGIVSSGEELMKMGEEDLARGEAIGVGAALVILVIVFGALIAAGLPILLAVISIAISMGITAMLSQMWSFSFFITNMITMIGLAVGIDYTLFIVERYREERRHGRDRHDAIAVAGGTASKAVAFSGGTVVLALMGMFLLPASIFRALATGAIIVVVISVAATQTLIPALLSLLGDRIDWPRKRNYDAYARAHAHDDPTSAAAVYQGFWGRITKTVMARPVISVVLAIALLVAASIPYWSINTGFAGVETM